MTGAQAIRRAAAARVTAANFMIWTLSGAECYRASGRAASPYRRQGLWMLNLLKDFAARKQDTRLLYDALVRRAREPVFFAVFGVADSMDGRFDVLVFHAW